MGSKKHTLGSIASTLCGGANSVGSSLASVRDGVAYGIGEAFAGFADCVGETAECTFTIRQPLLRLSRLEAVQYLCCQTL